MINPSTPLLTPQLITTYAAPVPRYTSYPTAPHFHGGVDAVIYGTWLQVTASGP